MGWLDVEMLAIAALGYSLDVKVPVEARHAT